MAVNFTTLTGAVTATGSIAYWINYSRIDAAGILTEAQAWLYTRLRVREMISTADVSIASDASTAALPTGFLDPVQFTIPGYVARIKYKGAETFRAELGWDTSAALPEAPPGRWTVIDETIQFDSKADQAYTAKMAYYKTPTALSLANETNWLTIRYPTLLRRVCTMFAAEARKEYDLMDRSEIKALEMIEEVKRENDLVMRGMELDFNWEPSD